MLCSFVWSHDFTRFERRPAQRNHALIRAVSLLGRQRNNVPFSSSPTSPQSGTVVPITLVVGRAGPEPAQLRRWRRRHGRRGDDCPERDTGYDSTVIGCADPRPDTADIDCSAAVRSTHGGRAGGTANRGSAIRPTNRRTAAGPRRRLRHRDHGPRLRRKDHEPRLPRQDLGRRRRRQDRSPLPIRMRPVPLPIPGQQRDESASRFIAWLPSAVSARHQVAVPPPLPAVRTGIPRPADGP